jgi:predicted RNase H-like nuclease (RuvC/YqgF family)
VVKDLKTQLDEVLKDKIRLEEETKLLPRLQAELDRMASENKRLEKQLEEDSDLNSRDRQEAKALRARLESLEKEKMALLADRTALQEQLDDISDGRGIHAAAGFGGTATDPDTLEVIPIAVREKMLRLEHEVKLKAGQVAALEAQVAEQKTMAASNPRQAVRMSSHDEESEVEQLRNRVAYLEELGDKKTMEIQEMEERYKKYLEKAKVRFALP